MRGTSRHFTYCWCLCIVSMSLTAEFCAGKTPLSSAGAAPGQASALSSTQLQALNTAFANLLSKRNLTSNSSKANTEATCPQAQTTQVSPAGGYLANLVKQLDQEVASNEAQRVSRKRTRGARSYREKPWHPNSEEVETAVHSQRIDNLSAAALGNQDAADGHADWHSGVYSKDDAGDHRKRVHASPKWQYQHAGTSWSIQAWLNQQERPTASGPAEFSSDSQASGTVVRLQEAGRSGCTEVQGAHNARGAVVYVSQLVTCTPSAGSSHKLPGGTAVAGIGVATDTGRTQERSNMSVCTWKVNFLENPEVTAPGITRIGFGAAICRLNKSEEMCGGQTCDGLSFKAEVSVYRVFAISDSIPLASTNARSCKLSNSTKLPAPSPEGHGLSIGEILVQQHDKMDKEAMAASLPNHHKALDTPEAKPLDSNKIVYGGEAIIFTGHISSVHAHGQSVANALGGMLEYVENFDARRLTTVEAQELPEDIPFVRPNSLKLLLVPGKPEA